MGLFDDGRQAARVAFLGAPDDADAEVALFILESDRNPVCEGSIDG